MHMNASIVVRASLERIAMNEGDRPRVPPDRPFANTPVGGEHGALDALDFQWVCRLAAGDLNALGEVFDCHAGAVLGFARRLLGDEASAQDLLQEVFITLGHAARSFRGQSSLRTFLLSIAVNHSRHFIRAAARKRATEHRMEQSASPSTQAESPEGLLMRAELARHLSDALEKLPLDQRVAFVLSEVDDLTSTEIAAIVGVPESTVRTRVFHARAKLRQLLAKRGLP